MAKKTETEPLRNCVRNALDHYFLQLDGRIPVGLYDMVLAEIERPMFACVMEYMGGNQTRAASAHPSTDAWDA